MNKSKAKLNDMISKKNDISLHVKERKHIKVKKRKEQWKHGYR
jgi:hypothetical protein